MIYNVILQSSLGNGAGGTIGETFFYDWTQMEDCKYKVSFSFISAVATLTNTAVGTIYVDLGQSQNKLASGQAITPTVFKGSFLGCLLYSGTGANTYLYADVKTNPSTYIGGRPRNNNFFVEIHQNSATTTDNYTPATGQYTLILNFEKIEE